MQFSKQLIILTFASLAITSTASADVKAAAKAFICKNYPNDPGCAKADVVKPAVVKTEDVKPSVKVEPTKPVIETDKVDEAEELNAEANAEANASNVSGPDEDDEDTAEQIANAQPAPVVLAPAPAAPMSPLGLFDQQNSQNPQRASGETAEGLKWQVNFNFPVCDHSDQGQPKGAYCEGTDSSASEKANGVEANLISWIKDPATKGLYLSYFSFSNKNISAALCAETSARPDLKVVVYLDKGEAQIGGFETNLNTVDKEISTPGNRRYIEGYKTGCLSRINPRETTRGSGAFGGDGNYLQHTKIFMALDQAELPSSPADLNNWVAKSKRIRWTSSSANMSSFGTTLHFDNWLFFDAPATNYTGLQNVCAMVGFKAATNAKGQRQQFKDTYAACEAQIKAPPSKDLKFLVVPSTANLSGQGPSQNLVSMINSAKKSILVAIHRFTTSTLATPLGKKAKSGLPVRLIQDDDTLRKGVADGGPGADVGADDVAIMRRNIDAGIDMNFMQTNASTTVHMFHSKYVIIDNKLLFQGAGNFTSTSLNVNSDGNYEHFYVIAIPELVNAYTKAWTYLQTIATPRKQHPVGSNEYYCTASDVDPTTGKKKTTKTLVRCSDSRAEDAKLEVN